MAWPGHLAVAVICALVLSPGAFYVYLRANYFSFEDWVAEQGRRFHGRARITIANSSSEEIRCLNVRGTTWVFKTPLTKGMSKRWSMRATDFFRSSGPATLAAFRDPSCGGPPIWEPTEFFIAADWRTAGDFELRITESGLEFSDRLYDAYLGGTIR